MTETQHFEEIPVASLLEKVRALQGEGCRLAQIGATTVAEGLEINYSFAREANLLNLRLRLPSEGANIPSISSIYWCAFIYENEIHDLFNVEVTGMAVDFKGNFYNTSVKHPFGSRKAPAVPATNGSKPAEKPAASGLSSHGE